MCQKVSRYDRISGLPALPGAKRPSKNFVTLSLNIGR
ncbi:hypothetical protein ABID59_004825 [Bradyrhizobium sp. S3.3.6]